MNKIIFALIFMPIVAMASEWKDIANNGEMYISVDLKSIVKTGKYTKAWMEWDFMNPQKSADYPPFIYLSSKILTYFSCGERTSGSKKEILYSEPSGAGSAKNSFDKNEKDIFYSDITPDTLGESSFEYVCNEQLRIEKLLKGFGKWKSKQKK